MLIAQVIARLKAEQQSVALDSLRRGVPEGADAAYHLGRASGVVAGLERAIDLINQILADEDKDTNL